jgi:hypothetical protein
LINPAQKKRIESVLKRRIKSPKKRGKGELVKNKMNTRHNLPKTNPGGHEVVRATIPAAMSRVLIQFSQIMDLSLTSSKGEGKP